MSERFLRPIREDVYNLIPENSSVIDIGCGKGKLLYKLSDKINYGLGIDIDERKIKNVNKKYSNTNNLEFEVADFSKMKNMEKFDYSIAMFSLHSMNKSSRKKTLGNMKEISKKQIILDYNWPKNLFYRFLILTDELLAGHLGNFLNYKNETITLNPQISERFYFIGFLK